MEKLFSDWPQWHWNLEPDVPRNISIISDSLNEIEISWNKSHESKQFGNVDKYLVIIRKSNSSFKTLREVLNETFKIENSEMCTQC